jgi:hypothetical protein
VGEVAHVEPSLRSVQGSILRFVFWHSIALACLVGEGR